MTVLLDTSALFAFLKPDDAHHGEAKDLFLRIAHGEHGVAFVMDWVVAELFTLLRACRDSARLEEGAHRLLPLPHTSGTGLRLVTLGPYQLEEVWKVFERHRARKLSFTDAAQLVVQQSNRIDRLATFDKALDALANGRR